MRISIEEAAYLLKEGSVVGVPTETVYGLAASLFQPKAIGDIFSLKGRPSSNPLIVHLAKAEDLHAYILNAPKGLKELIATFWPGPLTIVLSVDENKIPSIVRANLSTAAFRVPSHLTTMALLKKTGPLVMPSANLSGKPSSTTAKHVEDDFGVAFPVVDGNSSDKGIESTILFYTDGKWAIIRQGAISREALEPVLGYFPVIITGENTSKPLCPGQSYRHYSPEAKLHLTYEVKENAKVVVGFSNRHYPYAKQVFYLGSSKDPDAAIKNLYAILRELDEKKICEAWVDVDFPENGLWATLRERLSRTI